VSKTKVILNGLGSADRELSILVVNDEAIAEMNAAYLGHEGSTNVISFPMQEGDCSGIQPQLLGDVVISIDTAEREGLLGGMTVEERFDELLIHGILHLHGYDHIHDEEQAAKMEAKSRELMDLIKRERY
jgi:probable rRNA maturation factor